MSKFMFKAWLPAIICALIIFILTSMPKTRLYNDAEKKIPGEDKTEHVIAYAPLGFLVLRAGFKQFKRETGFLVSLLSSFVYSGLDELHQIIVPGRYCRFDDFLANILGLCIGFFLLLIIKRLEILKGLL